MESISVVIPLYNKAPFILRAINSILKQTKLPREVIVIDDGSTDGGGDLVDQLQDSLIRLIRQENQGVSVARNLGISLAKGELIAFLDADDEWKPKFLEVICEMRRLYPQAGAYATAFDIISSQGRRIMKKFKGFSSPCNPRYIDNLFSVDIDPGLMLTSAVVIPKDVFEQVGYFKKGEYLAEDIDLWVRIGISYPVVFSNTILATWHKNASNRAFGVQKLFNEPAFSITIDEAISSSRVSPEKIEHLREYGAYWRYWAVRQLIVNNKQELAVKIINKTRGTRRFYQQGRILLILAHLPPSYIKNAIMMYRTFFVDTKNIYKKLKEPLP